MKLKYFSSLAVVVAAVAFPISALADMNGTATLSSGSTLNLDTGATATSGGDIQFTGTSIMFQGNAKGADLGPLGQAGFSTLSQAYLQLYAGSASTAPIPSTSLGVGEVFAVITNGGNSAKVLVTAVSSSSIGLQYTTFGVSGGGGSSGGPTVTSVVNNYSYIPVGFSNSGIAPGSIMTIFGTGMSVAPTGTVTLQSSAGSGIPKMLGGTTLAVTVGSTTVTPAIYYATPSQIAAVLPSNTPTGSATLTVSYNGTSAPFSFQVVPNALGFDTYYGTGSGLLTATDANGVLFNYTNSVKPGQTIVLWGSGLGADTADSDIKFTGTPHAVNTPVQIYFGNVAGKVLYAGSSGYPGLNQIDVQVPSSVPTGCNVAVVGVVGSGASATTSNFGSLPFNQAGGECIDTLFGRTGSTIGNLSGQGTVRSGDVFVGQITSIESGAPKTSNFAFAGFESFTGAIYGSSNGSVSLGGCIVTEVISTGGGTVSSTGLDAGTLTVMGPTGSFPLMNLAKGSYEAALPDGAITSSGGTFTFTGSGGADVGGFTATVNLPNPILAWTNQSAAATINRGQGVQVNWDGGASGSIVFIIGSSSDSSTGASGSFFCLAQQSALSFTVPAYVTGTLPPGTGSFAVENLTGYSNFTAPKLDIGFGYGFTGVSIISTYQ